MAIPTSIHTLLDGGVVEWARIEFKTTWDPEASLKTICAFANDIDNWGGGYVVIGVSQGEGGRPRELVGVPDEKVDTYLKGMLASCKKIQPDYMPIVEVAAYEGKKFIIAWCHGGSIRPYSTPKHPNAKKSERVYWIRKMSSTIQPSEEEKRDLYNLSNNVPFDDRVNHGAELADLNLQLIKSYLREIGSSLYGMADEISFAELCRSMNIAEGPDEYLLPKNVGLLFFTMNPEKWFPYAQIDVVEFPDGEGGDRLYERTFTGPVQQQLREALQYLQNSVIKEEIVKSSSAAEADRHFNYPYVAIREALSNAVYHKGYDSREPIEVRVLPDRIEILSYPGADRSISIDGLREFRAVSRRYRNRRVGEFLKELHLTEGRNTGFNKILQSLRQNGSPEPRFETDEGRHYFLVTLYAWKEELSFSRHDGEDSNIDRGHRFENIVERRKEVLRFFTANPKGTLADLCAGLEISRSMADRDVAALKKDGRLERVGSSFSGYWRVR